MVNREEKSLGTKNLLDHLKHCSHQVQSKSSIEVDGSSGSNTVWRKILTGENFNEWACGKF